MKIGRCITTFGFALLAACASAQPTAPAGPAPRPALWKLADKDTTIWLFGTIHVLPKELRWRTTRFDAALAQSEALVLEVADTENPSETAGAFLRMARSPGLPQVTDRIPEASRAQFQRLAEKAGTPLPLLDSLESWAVAITLAAGILKDIGVSPEDGVERQLSREFKARSRPIMGLETSAEQFSFFDGLSENAQRTFLTSMIDESSDPKAEFDAMINAWALGDDTRIAMTFDDELKLSPELADALLRSRNANWTRWLEKRLESPGTIMVAVGAGHLTGPDSVQAMLKKRGLKTKRVQ